MIGWSGSKELTSALMPGVRSPLKQPAGRSAARRIAVVVVEVMIVPTTVVVATVVSILTSPPVSATTINFPSGPLPVGAACGPVSPFGAATCTFTVPAGVTELRVRVAGAGGGKASNGEYGPRGGAGAILTQTIPVTPGTTLGVNIAGRGSNGSVASGTAGTGGPGFANGGDGGGPGTRGAGGGGGGASAICAASPCVATNPASTPLIVAGGGGGGGGGDALGGLGGTAYGGAAGAANSNGQPGETGGITGTPGAAGLRDAAGTPDGGPGEPGDGPRGMGGGGGGAGYSCAGRGGGGGGGGGELSLTTAGSASGGGGAGGLSSYRPVDPAAPGGVGTCTDVAPSALTTSSTDLGAVGFVEITYYTTTTAVTRTSGPSPSFVGQPVTFTATVTPEAGAIGSPTGTVTFYSDVAGGTVIAGCVNVPLSPTSPFTASCTTSTLPPGSYTITAVYSGGGLFASSTGATTHGVVPVPAPRLTKTPSCATSTRCTFTSVGDTVTYTYTVVNPSGGAPLADLVVNDGGTIISCSTSPNPNPLPAGQTATCSSAPRPVTATDVANGEILNTATASGTAFGNPVQSNPFSVSVDVVQPQPGLAAILVNTDNSIGVTP
jgi:uncharacterized repeat protein (TIGR01451 family)